MKKKYYLHTKELEGDLISPIAAYLQLRDYFTDCKLLESSEYSNKKKSKSILAFKEISSIIVNENKVVTRSVKEYNSKSLKKSLVDELNDYYINLKNSIHSSSTEVPLLLGHFNYETISYFESLKLKNKDHTHPSSIQLGFFEYVLIFNHSQNRIHLLNYTSKKYADTKFVEGILSFINTTGINFKTIGAEKKTTKKDYCNRVKVAKQQCKMGNIFQVVISRKFEQKFIGDEFLVYRRLRQLNPSPYMFYFDNGDHKLFGSSPETQILTSEKKTYLYPIAGTIKKTGNEEIDIVNKNNLINDIKENAEHDMLIDLARNDLSRNCNNVVVSFKKQLQEFSHVYHLTSCVEGLARSLTNIFNVVESTFPAGTLSGAPKYKAMEIIDEIEPHARNFYGGSIGYISLNGDINFAIMIRSFCSKNNVLNYCSGAGITINSDPDKEFDETENKINALRTAIKLAESTLN